MRIDEQIIMKKSMRTVPSGIKSSKSRRVGSGVMNERGNKDAAEKNCITVPINNAMDEQELL